MDKVLVSAGIFSEVDNMEGISANIITGQGVKSGTNSFDLYINTEMIPEQKQSETQNLVYPPEQNINEKPEINYSPAFIPVDSPESFEFNDDFMEKMNSSKEVKLDNYIKAIGAQQVFADDNDFNFGYGISDMEEYILPTSIIGQVDVNITKSDENVRNRRRRKR